jgi:hypothetical protein
MVIACMHGMNDDDDDEMRIKIKCSKDLLKFNGFLSIQIA